MIKKEPSVEIVEHSQHAVVYPQGYLNGSTGEKIDHACTELMRKGKDRIIINFGRVETINTMGIANLVSVLEKIGRRNGMICFSDLGTSNRQIFDVLDISRAVLIFDDEGAATRHLADRYGVKTEDEGEKAEAAVEAAAIVEEEVEEETGKESQVESSGRQAEPQVESAGESKEEETFSAEGHRGETEDDLAGDGVI